MASTFSLHTHMLGSNMFITRISFFFQSFVLFIYLFIQMIRVLFLLPMFPAARNQTTQAIHFVLTSVRLSCSIEYFCFLNFFFFVGYVFRCCGHFWINEKQLNATPTNVLTILSRFSA